VDDKEANVLGARAVGMQAIRFQSVEQLAKDLKKLEFPVLPVPSR
jgi:FMN phosphatase YigB (HAD superfamily)